MLLLLLLLLVLVVVVVEFASRTARTVRDRDGSAVLQITIIPIIIMPIIKMPILMPIMIIIIGRD